MESRFSSTDSFSRNRDHKHGSQGTRSYTEAQKSAVERVRKCKHTEYYAILDIETTATDNQIKKAYRKLALIMHPDKNGAPGADEAFKMVSKAFQILSDPQKKSIFDKTGSDPDSRFSSTNRSNYFNNNNNNNTGTPNGFPFFTTGVNGPELSAEDLFNMFFGTTGANGPFQSNFPGFGSPGIRVHTFGPGARARNNHNNNNNQNNQPTTLIQNLMQFIPLFLLFLIPIFTSLFSDSSTGFSTRLPNHRFDPKPPFTIKRFTPQFNIPYYLSKNDIENYSKKQMSKIDSKIESQYISSLQMSCQNERDLKRQRIADAYGWFFTDSEKLNKAQRMHLPSCERLQNIGAKISYY